PLRERHGEGEKEFEHNTGGTDDTPHPPTGLDSLVAAVIPRNTADQMPRRDNNTQLPCLIV
ncbi:MAG TPA: hypothetical protein DEP46_07785, partial [Blastocatellia bacterium]|nr:hypothetical protein [Blastocatellia bacterium]